MITFPGATNLSAAYRVGTDGAITMPYIGVVRAVNKTPSQLEEELKQRYATELRDNEVIVSLAAGTSIVYITGAVLRPGRVAMDRPLTVLEGIMEAGGYSQTANLRKVGVIRWEDGRNVRFTLDLTPMVGGAAAEPFYLRSRDIVEVPQKPQWF